MNETQFRDLLHYDDTHLPVMSADRIVRAAEQRTARRRGVAGTLAAVLALGVAAGGYLAWERQPRIMAPNIAYASGETLVLPDGSIDTFDGKARAWLMSNGDVCWGNDAGSVCGPMRETPGDGAFEMFSTAKSDGVLGGQVHRSLKQASFTTPDGQDIRALVIQFKKYPGWSVVITAVPRAEDGKLPSPKSLTLNTD